MQVVYTDKRLPLEAAWGLRLGGGQTPSFPIQYSEALFTFPAFISRILLWDKGGRLGWSPALGSG